MNQFSPQSQASLFENAFAGNQSSGTASPKTMRPYQVDGILQVYRHIASGLKRVCLIAPTGAGKTILASKIVGDAVAKGRRVAFCVPAISLIDQTVSVFESQGIGPIGVVQADHPRVDPLAMVQVCSVQTLGRRGWPDGVEVVVVDEAHIFAKPIAELMAREPETIFIGMTATPGRKGMAEEYQASVVTTTLGDLTEQGYLSKYRVFSPSAPDVSNVKTVAGDFHKGQLSEVVKDPKLTADIVETWADKAQGRPTLVYAVDRAHAALLQAEFQKIGINCGYQDAHTDPIERKFIAKEFRELRMPVVANVGTLTTGVDWDVRCIVLARPTQSKMLHVQIVGRGLRTAEGKLDCMILDHAGNFERIGFPEKLDWSTLLPKGREKEKAKKKEPMPKPCSKCSYVMAPRCKVCPSCGFEAGPPSGFIETADGELVEVGPDGKAISPKDKVWTREEKQLWWSSIIHEQRRLNKSPGYAAHTYRDKFGVWPRGLDDDPCKPIPEVLSFIRAKNIRFAKSKEAKK